PNRLKGHGRSGKVHTSEISMGQKRLASKRSIGWDQIDHSVGKSSFLKELVDAPGRKHLGVGGFPNDRIPQHRGYSGQIARDRREVKRRDRQDKALERAIVRAIPNGGTRSGLLL